MILIYACILLWLLVGFIAAAYECMNLNNGKLSLYGFIFSLFVSFLGFILAFAILVVNLIEHDYQCNIIIWPPSKWKGKV